MKTRNRNKSESAVSFFYANAGYGWNPKKETQEQGRMRCAKALARAERKASIAGYSYLWELDGMTNREWTDEGEETPTWQGRMFDADGVCVAGLYGIDFGSGEPWGNPYRRVVEAELALEWL